MTQQTFGMTVDLGDGQGEHDVQLLVDYDYSPGEPMILNPIEKAHPGADPEVTINGAYANGQDYLPYLSAYQKEALEQEILEHEQDLTLE